MDVFKIVDLFRIAITYTKPWPATYYLWPFFHALFRLVGSKRHSQEYRVGDSLKLNFLS